MPVTRRFGNRAAQTSGVKTRSAANLNQVSLLTVLEQEPKSIRDRFRMVGE